LAGEKLTKLTEELNMAAARAEAAAKSLEGASKAREDTDANTAGKVSYTEAMRRTPQGHADTVAWVEIQKRQVVVRKITGDSADPFQGLTEKEITAKAQMAITVMTKDGDDEADQVEFLTAKRLPKGGAVLVTRTEDAARWLRADHNILRFSERLGGSVMASADLCMVIAEYVPISFAPESLSALTKIERDSHPEKGAVKEAHFIKKIGNRAEGQRNAHVIIGITEPDQANIAIRGGLVIEGKAVSVRRHMVDPRRCLKCQQVGANHIAADCKALHETCGRCTGNHRTAECTVKD
jgi:hypothetical protein